MKSFSFFYFNMNYQPWKMNYLGIIAHFKIKYMEKSVG